MADDPRLWQRIAAMITEAVRKSEHFTQSWLMTGMRPFGVGLEGWPTTVMHCSEHGGPFQAFYRPAGMFESGKTRCPACLALDARMRASTLVTRAELDGLRREVASLREQLAERVERGGVET